MRKILLVIDMQNDLIDATLEIKEAVSIVDAVKEKIRSYPEENVYATMDTTERISLRRWRERTFRSCTALKGQMDGRFVRTLPGS